MFLLCRGKGPSQAQAPGLVGLLRAGLLRLPELLCPRGAIPAAGGEIQMIFVARRGTWTINPVTRKPANPKAYNRKTARKWKDDSHSVPFVSVFAPL